MNLPVLGIVCKQNHTLVVVLGYFVFMRQGMISPLLGSLFIEAQGEGARERKI